jgi:hypothetical protein
MHIKISKATILFSSVVVIALAVIPAAPAFASEDSNSSISTSLSANWTGYVADSGNNYTSVTGTWVVPSVSTSQQVAADATWVGIGGMSGRNDLIQAGTQAIIQNGSITYTAWYETLPQVSVATPLTVHAGDTITTTLNESSQNMWAITIADVTTNQQYSTTIPYASSLSSAEWIQEMPSTEQGSLPLDTFSSIPFTNASTMQNGSSENLTQAGARALTLVASDNGTILAYPSAINNDGSSFTVTRANPQSSVQPYIVSPVSSETQFGSRGFTRSPRHMIPTEFISPGSFEFASSSTKTFTSNGMTMTVTSYSF